MDINFKFFCRIDYIIKNVANLLMNSHFINLIKNEFDIYLLLQWLFEIQELYLKKSKSKFKTYIIIIKLTKNIEI